MFWTVLFLVGATFLIAFPRVGAGDPEWVTAGRSLGLKLEKRGSSMVMKGQVQGASVEIDAVYERGELLHRVQVGDVGIPESVSIHGRAADEMAGSARGEECTTGIPEFDRDIHVEGDPYAAFALLSVQGRKSAFELVTEFRAHVTRGRVIYRGLEVPGTANFLPLVLGRILAAARALSISDPGPYERLFRNVERDPAPRVRRKSLELLLDRHQAEPKTIRATELALHDADPRIRLIAGVQKGPDGSRTLCDLVESGSVPESIRARGLQVLLETMPWEAIHTTVARCLSPDTPEEVRNMAISRSGELRLATAVEALIGLTRHDDAETVSLSVLALGQIADPTAEPAILGLLDRIDQVPLQLKVVEALSTLGTARSVEPLLKLVGGTTIKTSAREAIRRIQSRLGDVDAGRLSIVESADGAGSLSLAPEPGGLSIPPQADVENAS